jgi:uncharacterized protein (DUF4415 family)
MEKPDMKKTWTKDNWPTEEQIQEMIASDPDNPGWTDEELANARPFAEVFPEPAEAFRKQIGRPKAEAPKVAVSIRLDRDVVERFRATGKGWQTRINEVLKAAKL